MYEQISALKEGEKWSPDYNLYVKTGENWVFVFITRNDRFFNGSLYNFSYFYRDEELELPKTVNLKMSGITKEYYTYFEILVSQGGQEGGGPFQAVPSSLLGNMINTTKEENFPLGYFHISETDTFTIELVEKE